MKKTLFFCLIAFCFAFGARQSLVVLPCIGGFDPNGLERLRDKVEEVARNTLPTSDFRLIPYKDVREEVGDEALFDACEEGGICFGRLTGQANADYGAWCMVNKDEGKWLLKFQLYSVVEKDILFTKEYDSYNSKSLGDLIGIVKKEVPVALREKMLGISPEVKELVKINISFWAGIGLDLLGAALVYVGYMKDKDMVESIEAYNVRGQTDGYYDDAWKKAEDSRSNRNIFYVIGGVVLASGIGVHIWF